MKAYHAVLLALCLSACAQDPAQPDTLQISGLRRGLVKFDDAQRPSIYQEGDTFTYSPNGECVAAGKTESCVWHGFELDYVSPEDEATISCKSIANVPRDETYPDAVVVTHSRTAPWWFVLEGRSGHYIRPQYDILYLKPGQTFIDKSVCYYKGAKVFSLDITFTAPVDGAKSDTGNP